MYFRGVVLPLGEDRISMTSQAIRFNHDNRLDERWASSDDFCTVAFEDDAREDVVGTVTRHDTHQLFEVILSRRGPLIG